MNEPTAHVDVWFRLKETEDKLTELRKGCAEMAERVRNRIGKDISLANLATDLDAMAKGE